MLTHYINDQYGSVRAGMSGSTVLTKLEYYPYGEVYSMSGGGSVYTFLGKEDPGVGMLDFGPRYYNAMLGRFLRVCPIPLGWGKIVGDWSTRVRSRILRSSS